MLSRLSQIFFTFLTHRLESVLSAAMLIVAHELLKKGKQTLFLIILSFVLAVLFAAGTIISLLESSAQYDARGFVYFNALLSSSLTMTGVSALILAIIFWPRHTHFANKSLQTHEAHPQNPFEEILTAALNEGVQYFKQRQAAKARSTEYAQASP